MSESHAANVNTEINVAIKRNSFSTKIARDAIEILSSKEKLLTIAGLGAIALATTIAEHNGVTNSWIQPFASLRDSDRHLEVGYISALLASKREYANKSNKVTGMLLAGFMGNALIEATQSMYVTEMYNRGLVHVFDFLRPSQVVWNNTQDAAAAMLASGYAAIRETTFLNPNKSSNRSIVV